MLCTTNGSYSPPVWLVPDEHKAGLRLFRQEVERGAA